MFEREMARLGLSAGAAILEAGFGEGRFLDWARDQGYAVEGIEISASYVEAARARGHDVFLCDAADFGSHCRFMYDAIVCFDVLEHLTADEIVAFFHSTKRALAPGGAILARFPNGASPFGRLYQHGDATHVSILTALKIDQLAFVAGLEVSNVFNAARAVRCGRLLGIPARIRKALAAAIEWTVGQIYFGARQPLDPNLVVHFRHRGPGTAA
jgi:2-polyprenyl-3-methyl-5-hydroxy-6-metoxy-1,4-benzoquinol methylase